MELSEVFFSIHMRGETDTERKLWKKTQPFLLSKHLATWISEAAPPPHGLPASSHILHDQPWNNIYKNGVTW